MFIGRFPAPFVGRAMNWPTFDNDDESIPVQQPSRPAPRPAPPNDQPTPRDGPQQSFAEHLYQWFIEDDGLAVVIVVGVGIGVVWFIWWSIRNNAGGGIVGAGGRDGFGPGDGGVGVP